jgi:23S rRNA (pseudouridine1915-N3)-methyltransferase
LLNITLICVGGLKEDYWKAACAEYIKRLGAWARVNTVEIEETRLPENPSSALINAAQNDEADRITKKLPANSFIAALCIEGVQMDSEEFAQVISRQMQLSGSFTFIIGGSYGLAKRLKDSAGLRMSLSVMTFPHMMARVLLLEQLYRAMSILGGGRYHK